MKTDKYMDIKPYKKNFRWETDKDGKVTLKIERAGFLKKIFKLPKVSLIYFDEFGSFVWKQIDGENNIKTIGESMEERFGESASPVYERLLKYLKILKSYNFIGFNG